MLYFCIHKHNTNKILKSKNYKDSIVDLNILIAIFVIKKIDKQSKYYSINIRRKCFLKKVNQN